MQTFLPYKEFSLSAAVLDKKRLGCQRKEAKQILGMLESKKYTCKFCKNQTDDPDTAAMRCCEAQHKWRITAWYNRPAVRMWRGHNAALVEYGLACCKVWVDRGYNDTLTEYFLERRMHYTGSRQSEATHINYPVWLGSEQFHNSHRSMLIKKDRDCYKPHFPHVTEGLEYHWPV
jgi:hypothetical protein